mgnify:CR=1 FL=1
MSLIVPVDPVKRDVVAALPSRTAHALHGMMEASRNEKMPVTAAEACIYDFDAISPRATARSLRHAATLGYCVYTGRYWCPLNAAYDLRYALEDRALRDEDDR